MRPLFKGGYYLRAATIKDFTVNRSSTRSPGTWRDLNFWPRTIILVFFEVLGLDLEVLKCVLSSENFHVILGTLHTM